MSVPFVNQLRARREPIRLGASDAGDRISVRVEIPEIWDVVLVETASTESVLAVKNAALAALLPKADQRAYVLKLRGFEVLNETESLADAGALDGSTFLLTFRRRRPVK